MPHFENATEAAAVWRQPAEMWRWMAKVGTAITGAFVSPLTTKGDIWGFDTADNRIPVGSDTQVLTADSSQPLGVKWAPASGGTTSPLTTKGDVWGFTTTDARVPIGSATQIAQVDSAQAAGWGWKTVSADATIATGGALTLATVNSNVGTFGDGINAVTITANAKGLVTAVSTVAQETFHAQSQASAATIDYTVARVHKLTLGGAPVAITLAGTTNNVACDLTIYLVQDGSGNRTVTWPGSVKWPGGNAPILSTGSGAIDLVVMESFDNGTSWFANLSGRAYA